MKLVFRAGQEIIETYVAEDRSVSFAGRATNWKRVPIDKLYQGNPDEDLDLRTTKAIIKELNDPRLVEHYIIYEFRRQGLEHVKTEWKRSGTTS